MAKALPQMPRRNAPWTPLQRRTWLAEQRRKKHLLPAPLSAPTLALVVGNFVGTAPVAASVWRFAQNDGGPDSQSVADWADGADLSNAPYDLLPPNQAQSARQFSNCACCYQVAGVWSPWCAVI
jgi:hypothetical protein